MYAFDSTVFESSTFDLVWLILPYNFQLIPGYENGGLFLGIWRDGIIFIHTKMCAVHIV